jgi:hypothetical protein
MRDRAVSLTCFLWINLPVALFLLAAAGLLSIFFLAIQHWIFPALAWGALCGAVLLARDYHVRKRTEFLVLHKIREQRGQGSIPIDSLKATICGRCMLQALRLSTYKNQKEI